ncbi:hypothetical protein EVAR_54241_1 [Eumeta japonica]|uniref:Uncharacterized protein n=1 Tax=Eumeta variegata TaxID=151549 RepID=A0A4C1YJW8_EUMVA|nr:hypothetical protein EVAR_54241_1 [Eumeta japonica]
MDIMKMSRPHYALLSLLKLLHNLPPGSARYIAPYLWYNHADNTNFGEAAAFVHFNMSSQHPILAEQRNTYERPPAAGDGPRAALTRPIHLPFERLPSLCTPFGKHYYFISSELGVRVVGGAPGGGAECPIEMAILFHSNANVYLPGNQVRVRCGRAVRPGSINFKTKMLSKNKEILDNFINLILVDLKDFRTLIVASGTRLGNVSTRFLRNAVVKCELVILETSSSDNDASMER